MLNPARKGRVRNHGPRQRAQNHCREIRITTRDHKLAVNDLIDMDDLAELVHTGVMSTPTRESVVVDPPVDLDEMMNLAKFLDSHETPAILLGPDGEQLPLPLAIYQVLQQVVDAMERGASVSIQPVDRQLTTQQAASVLGVSRSTLLRLLEERELPYERLGEARHRRLRLNDVLAYRDRKSDERRSRLEELTRQAQEDGLYDVDATDYSEALRKARKG